MTEKMHLIMRDEIEHNIMEYAEKSDIIIFATGTGGDGNKTVLRMQKQMLDMLKPFQQKLNCITDAGGRKFYHPLCPAVRKWILSPFSYDELKAYQEEKAIPTTIQTEPIPETPEPQEQPEQQTLIPEEKPKRKKKTTRPDSQ